MAEQMPRRDDVPEATARRGKVGRERSVQEQLTRIDVLHRQRGRHDDLGQAREIVDRVRLDRRRVGFIRQPTVGGEMHESPLSSDRDDGTGERAPLHEVVDHARDLFQATRIEADFRRRFA